MRKLPLTIAAALVVSAASTLPAFATDPTPGITPPCVAQVNKTLGQAGILGDVRSSLPVTVLGHTIDNATLGKNRAAAVQGDGGAQLLEGFCNLIIGALD